MQEISAESWQQGIGFEDARSGVSRIKAVSLLSGLNA
jgi:hypothetical protein